MVFTSLNSNLQNIMLINIEFMLKFLLITIFLASCYLYVKTFKPKPNSPYLAVRYLRGILYLVSSVCLFFTPLYLFFLVLIALSVVVLIKSVGVILVIALLTLPASTAQLLSYDFKKIITWSIILAVFVNFFGIILSYYLNIPSGPAIILLAAIIYVLILIFKKYFKF